MNLSDTSKSRVVVWDFPDLQARFVTKNHSGLTTPAGWTLFEGIEPSEDEPSSFELRDGQLTIGASSFTVTDVNGTVSNFLGSNDAALSQTRAIRKKGLDKQAEILYAESMWVLEDYAIAGRNGGAYSLTMTSLLRQMSKGLFEGFDSEGHSLALAIGTTSTTLDVEEFEADEFDNWRIPGYGLMQNNDTFETELFSYTDIQNTGGVTRFSGMKRAVFGVGGDPSSGPDGTGTAFPAESAQVIHVWPRRGSPIDVMLSLLLSSPDSGPFGPSVAELLTNGSLDAWTSDIPDGWSKSGIGNSFITEETSVALGGSSARYEYINGGNTEVLLSQSLTGLVASKYYLVVFHVYIDDGVTGVNNWRLRILNTAPSPDRRLSSFEDRSTSEDEDLGNVSTWVDDDSILQPAIEGQQLQVGRWYRVERVFQTEASVAGTDSFSFNFLLGTRDNGPPIGGANNGLTGFIDRIELRGPYDSKPSSRYDDGTGDGLGIDPSLVDVTGIEIARDEFLPVPSFNANGTLSGGKAALFCESREIDDVKVWIEDHILRPYGFKPLVDEFNRFTIEPYFKVPPPVVDVGDKWRIKDFNPSKWKRNYANVINLITCLTDYDAFSDGHVHSLPAGQNSSQSKYKKSKSQKLENRGGRTGRRGFPNYGSMSDTIVAAGLIMLETSNPWTQIDVRVFYEFRDISMQDVVTMNIRSILALASGERGVQDQRFFVDSVSVDETEGYVSLTIRERRPISRPAFVGTQTNDYNTASASEREFCYLVEDDEDTFDDGSEAYTVV